MPFCSTCGSPNNHTNRFCISCGRPMPTPVPPTQPPQANRRRSWTWILKWAGIAVGSLVGLFILLIVLIAIFAGDGDDSQAQAPTTRTTPVPQSETTAVTPGPTTTPRPTATRQPPPTPIKVTANALERQHEANEVSWESKYVDRYVLITGSISSIAEAGNQYDVKLNTDNIWVDIVCKIGQSGRSSVLELAKGETITVYGLVTNAGIIDIVVRDCTIKPPEFDSTSEQDQTRVATPEIISVPRPTTTPNPTPTPNPFTQYQGVAKKAAILSVYVGTPTGSGSGFLYRLDDSERFVVLTNSHVVQDYSNVEICWAIAQKCIYEEVKNRGSENFDVAVLEFTQFTEYGLDTETLQWFEGWFESNIAGFDKRGSGWSKGDVVYASGYPGGHKVQGTDIISDPVVTEGIIASNRLTPYRNKAHFIEHGANIEPGSSGGPLMNNAASIVGINTGTNLLTEQLELAIPMNSVIEWLETGEEPSFTRTP